DGLGELQIETRFDSAAVGLEPKGRTVTLGDGTTVSGDTILLTTGGRARTLPIPGADLPGVVVLRSYADAAVLRDLDVPGTRIGIVGAGLIGAELASSLVREGADVTLIDPISVPLVPAVGELLAADLHSMHESHGITV